MAIVDYQTIFCDKQVIEATSLSDRAIDLQALADYGMGRNWFVHVFIQGTHSNPLRVQVLGFTDNTFTNGVVVGDSDVYAAAKLVQGFNFTVPVNPKASKYRYLALRFVPTISGTETTEISSGTTATAGNMAVVPPVVGSVSAVANAVRAQLELLPIEDISYPHAGDDLSYSTAQNNG